MNYELRLRTELMNDLARIEQLDSDYTFQIKYKLSDYYPRLMTAYTSSQNPILPNFSILSLTRCSACHLF